LLIIFHVFSFTSALDRKKYSVVTEFIKMFLILGLFFEQEYIWFGLDAVYGNMIVVYSIISLFVTLHFYRESKKKLLLEV